MSDIIIEGGNISGLTEVLTISNVAKGFTSTKILPTTGDFSGKVCQEIFCTLDSDSDDLRFWTNGDTPTSTEGHYLAKGQNLTLKNPADIKNFLAIRVTTDAKLQVSYKFHSRV